LFQNLSGLGVVEKVFQLSGVSVNTAIQSVVSCTFDFSSSSAYTASFGMYGFIAFVIFIFNIFLSE
jgi:hypothetical protein